MPDPKPLLFAFAVLGLLIGFVCWLIRRAERKPVVYTLPASPCRSCGEVKRIWSDPWMDEPSHRYCSCSRTGPTGGKVGVRWDEWEERNAA